jgi:hypothetical protein
LRTAISKIANHKNGIAKPENSRTQLWSANFKITVRNYSQPHPFNLSSSPNHTFTSHTSPTPQKPKLLFFLPLKPLLLPPFQLLQSSLLLNLFLNHLIISPPQPLPSSSLQTLGAAPTPNPPSLNAILTHRCEKLQISQTCTNF